MPINVALIGLSLMTSQLIREVLSRPDIHLVGEFAPTARLPDETDGIDVAIVGSDGSHLPQLGLSLLRAQPLMKVLTVVGDGKQGFLYELRPHRTPLGEISAATLLAAVRGVGRDP